jgi:hypothetical protein
MQQNVEGFLQYYVRLTPAAKITVQAASVLFDIYHTCTSLDCCQY